MFTAQRFALDWEQLDDQYRILVGDRANPASYVIYGAPVFAVAHARIIAAVDGLPDSPPGSLPPNIPGQRVRRGQALGLGLTVRSGAGSRRP